MNRKWKSQARQKRPARMSFFACMMRFPLNLSHFHRRLLFCIFRFRGGGGSQVFFSYRIPSRVYVCLFASVGKARQRVSTGMGMMDGLSEYPLLHFSSLSRRFVCIFLTLLHLQPSFTGRSLCTIISKRHSF